MGHMDANLVCSASFEAAFYERRFVERFDTPIMRNSMFPARRIYNRHFLTVLGRSGEIGRYRVFRYLGNF